MDFLRAGNQLFRKQPVIFVRKRSIGQILRRKILARQINARFLQIIENIGIWIRAFSVIGLLFFTRVHRMTMLLKLKVTFFRQKFHDRIDVIFENHQLYQPHGSCSSHIVSSFSLILPATPSHLRQSESRLRPHSGEALPQPNEYIPTHSA